MKKVIVTGANGFIGSRLVRGLLAESVEVFAVVRDEKANINNIAGLDGVHIIYCDMSEYDALPQKVLCELGDGTIDVFFHLAWAGIFGEARKNHQVQLDNVSFTCRAFLVASDMKIPRFIYTTSIHEYGVIKDLAEGVNKINRSLLYGVGKLASHLMLSCLASDSDTSFFPVVISNVYGEGDIYPWIINSTIQKLLTGNTATFTHARQMCDFIYVDDVVRGIKDIACKGISEHNYYLGSCQIMPLYQYLERLKKVVNPDAKLIFGEIPFSGTSLTYSEFDIHRLNIDTGFKAEVSFEDGIKKTANWIMKNQLLPNGSKGYKTQQFSIEDTGIEGLKVVNPFYMQDERGYFIKDFEKTIYHSLGINDTDITECLESSSAKNVIRGMHFQTNNPQCKIVKVVIGRVFDVVLDLRRGSQTFGKWQGFELSAENKKVLYIPKGCAHGFISLCDNTVFSYKAVGKYDRETDTGIMWNDPDINIEWPLEGQAIISERDQKQMTFKAFVSEFGGL
jgi:dTDP-4-dehydrorhamnose 3,5-epimerase